MPENQRKEIYEVIENKLPHARLYQAQVNDEMFKLDIHLIHKF